MILLLQRKSGGVLLATVLAIMWPMAECAVTTPEIHAKVVDSETGEPQEWVKAIVYAGKVVHTIGGDVEPTLFTKTFYFHAKDGEIVIPSQHFSVFDFVRYKDWELVIKSPGHKVFFVQGKSIRKAIEDRKGSTFNIAVMAYRNGMEWEAGKEEWWCSIYSSEEDSYNPSAPAIYERGLIQEYTWLIANWARILPQRYGMSALMRETGLGLYAREYLRKIAQFCTKFSKVQPSRCLDAESEASRLFNALPSEIKAQIKLEDLQSDYEWLKAGEKP